MISNSLTRVLLQYVVVLARNIIIIIMFGGLVVDGILRPGILGWVPTCDRIHSWQLYSTAPLENQAVVRYSTQSQYPDTELTSPYHILLMLSTRLESK